MVTAALSALGGLFGSGTAAAGTAGAVGGAVGTAGTVGTVGGAAAGGLSISSILQGTAGVLSAVSAVSAGNAQAEGYEQAATEAQSNQRLTTLEGISRRSSIKQAMVDQVGKQDVAYAASGTDLSFGTPTQARKEAFREADLGTATQVGTEQTTQAQLSDRERNYRKMAGKARLGGWVSAATSLFSTGSSIKARGY
ncbi:hypothetical protein RvVAR0630_18220 [Agrobacterium vitis]|uniref:hypothetical protein n=1 Tax=Agrobacterium vitis TaxID=373 RepID=UPI0015D7B490|nr:hypothetical protein [Agrobacterium vitis]BCH59198.1 hypothetical protein RvVAR0630_18220 [Agrobacterium vitis]